MSTGATGLFGPDFIEQFLAAARPGLKTLIRDVITEDRSARKVLCVPYEEAGAMIGTSYEGIRKLVRKGKLKSVSRSGRRRGIAISEMESYVERNMVANQ
jgi:hypothetical protein